MRRDKKAVEMAEQVGEAAQARDLLLEVRANDPSLAYVSYLLAICNDCLEDSGMAASRVEKALRADRLR